jgi:hypothetical protein
VNHYYPGADDEEELGAGRQPVDSKLSRQYCWESPAQAWRRALRLVSLSRLNFEGDDLTCAVYKGGIAGVGRMKKS